MESTEIILIYEWIASGNFVVNWSIKIDPLSSIMLVIVTVSFCFSSYLFNRIYEVRS